MQQSSAPAETQHRVAILLAAYQGEKFLAQQLESFAKQTHSAWDLFISIDGNPDNTLALLDTFRTAWAGRHTITVTTGPQQGFAANFFSLLYSDAINYSYYACSDQDDIWMPEKLERAIAWLSTQPENKPLLYCSCSELIDENNQSLGPSLIYAHPPNFKNALVQNIAGGNTMVFNQTTKTVLTLVNDSSIPFHDWFIYLAVTASDGIVFYDRRPTILYRQHTHNVMGSNMGWRSHLNRVKRLLKGDYRNWNAKNMTALTRLTHLMSLASYRAYHDFAVSRTSYNIFTRLIKAKQAGIHRQTAWGNLGLLAATVLRKN
jgi:glycosyltransferase involved in cell wall biosynthesis